MPCRWSVESDNHNADPLVCQKYPSTGKAGSKKEGLVDTDKGTALCAHGKCQLARGLHGQYSFQMQICQHRP